jgi:hypothetical protein
MLRLHPGKLLHLPFKFGCKLFKVTMIIRILLFHIDHFRLQLMVAQRHLLEFLHFLLLPQLQPTLAIQCSILHHHLQLFIHCSPQLHLVNVDLLHLLLQLPHPFVHPVLDLLLLNLEHGGHLPFFILMTPFNFIDLLLLRSQPIQRVLLFNPNYLL